VPIEESGCCLGSEGNGVSTWKGGEGGPGPPERENDKQSCPTKAGTTWGRMRRTNQAGRDVGGLAQTE
jgi:hypothetical protein